MNHRALQRTLFRMLHDASFAARILDGEGAAVRSSGLGAAELALLRAEDRRAYSADRHGRRRAQLVRNVAGELSLSTSVAGEGRLDFGFGDGFASSPELHAAIAEDRPLPLAFAAYAARCAAEREAPRIAALVALEAALARVRRAPAPGRASRADATAGTHGATLRLASDVALITLPAGTFALSERLRARLDAGEPPPLAWPADRLLAPDAGEHVLVRPTSAPDPFRLRDASAERVGPLVAAFLDLAGRGPIAPDARAGFAREHDLSADDVESVASDFAADGVLVAG